jgi:hypothetical protein
VAEAAPGVAAVVPAEAVVRVAAAVAAPEVAVVVRVAVVAPAEVAVAAVERVIRLRPSIRGSKHRAGVPFLSFLT